MQTRRNLRSKVEKRSLTINENFLLAFKEVKTTLDGICDDIDGMRKTVGAMKQCLSETEAQTHELIQQTNALQDESKKLEARQEITSAFLTQFRLSVEEHQHLYGTPRDAPITNHFFAVLERIQSIHAECRILLQSNCQTAALDIMEEMTLHQEAGLERLYRWTQAHCRNVDSDISGLLQLAMNKLQDRPVLFKYVIDEYANARRSVFVRHFIDALTVGGPNGNPKPIEMHSHDPKRYSAEIFDYIENAFYKSVSIDFLSLSLTLSVILRYIGDMFAWLHQSIPIERENLMLLLKDCDKNDLSEQSQAALTHIADGVCHALKVRVETILNGCTDVITLYSVSNLIRFYQTILKQVANFFLLDFHAEKRKLKYNILLYFQIIKGGTLEECISNLQLFSESTYLKTLSQQVKELLYGQPGSSVGLEPPNNDLIPSHSVTRLLSILKEILSVASMVESRQTDITKIVSCVIDPLLHSITESASHLPTVDMAVYILNCLYQMQSTLGMFEYVDSRMERLQAQCDAQIDTLTSEQASSLVANLNLGPIYTLLQSSSKDIDPNHLKMFMVLLFEYFANG